jgi:hypothetical protein
MRVYWLNQNSLRLWFSGRWLRYHLLEGRHHGHERHLAAEATHLLLTHHHLRGHHSWERRHLSQLHSRLTCGALLLESGL